MLYLTYLSKSALFIYVNEFEVFNFFQIKLIPIWNRKKDILLKRMLFKSNCLIPIKESIYYNKNPIRFYSTEENDEKNKGLLTCKKPCKLLDKKLKPKTEKKPKEKKEKSDMLSCKRPCNLLTKNRKGDKQ